MYIFKSMNNYTHKLLATKTFMNILNSTANNCHGDSSFGKYTGIDINFGPKKVNQSKIGIAMTPVLYDVCLMSYMYAYTAMLRQLKHCPIHTMMES